LEDFPRRQPRPRTYREAAERLGEPWTAVTVRKQVERLKGRLRRAGSYIEGPQANFELAEYLIDNRLITPGDLARLPPGR
ncbi:MAG: hypothetical protein LC713_06990, partial [Actinobacteria bacterium]|nr:hypothetical protein [Actinomycetota bacterium]